MAKSARSAVVIGGKIADRNPEAVEGYHTTAAVYLVKLGSRPHARSWPHRFSGLPSPGLPARAAPVQECAEGVGAGDSASNFEGEQNAVRDVAEGDDLEDERNQ